MIRIEQIKLPVGHDETELYKEVSRLLGMQIPGDIKKEKLKILKRSLDCRKKPKLYYSYTIGVFPDKKTEEKLRRHNRNKRLIFAEETVYPVPFLKNRKKERMRPLIVGDGPAGLFCGYLLTLAGFAPTIIERGDSIDERTRKVEGFWRDGQLDISSNVQFGEGGAGTFSDGKLNSTIKDKNGRIGFVLDTFIKYGAKPSIAYDAKPHLGTDELKRIIAAMREAMKEAGCEFLFNTRVTDLVIKDSRVKGAAIDDKEEIPADTVVLAIGHSARDTVKMLYDRKLSMERKDFAMGFRVIHPQELINRAQYGEDYPKELPAADYKLTHTASNGKRVYTFCMCPGGYVVNASSEEGRLAVNGMSYSSRASGYANSAVVAAFESESFGDGGVLSGIELQRRIEEKAYKAGGGCIPVQSFGEFKNTVEKEWQDRKRETVPGELCIKGGVQKADLRNIFDGETNKAIIEAMESFDVLIPGFGGENVLFAAAESRTSSPVRILRDSESLMSNIYGIYPCGEGAGYAGGIMSAAVDGIKVAERIIEKENNGEVGE